MKILLFITSYRQVLEFKYFLLFFKALKSLPNQCDIFMYCNNVNVQDDLIRYFKEFNIQNKFLFVTSKNEGYRMGNTEAMSEVYNMKIFQQYDYVVHVHPDVFIIDDTQLMSVLETNLHNDICYFITKSIPNDEKYASLDFFIFKPALLQYNIFIDEIYNWTGTPEHYFYEMLVKHNVKFTFIPRFGNDNYLPRRIAENIGIWHEHDLGKVKNYLEQNGLLESSELISPSELPCIDLTRKKQITIQHTAEFNLWNLYLANQNYELSTFDIDNKSVVYKNKAYAENYLVVIDVFNEEEFKRVNPILFCIHILDSSASEGLSNIVINTNIEYKTKIMQYTCIHLFNYNFILNETQISGLYSIGSINNKEKYKGILYLDTFSLLNKSIESIFSNICSPEKSLIYKSDKNVLITEPKKDTLINILDSTKHIQIHSTGIVHNIEDYISPFQEILRNISQSSETKQDKQISNSAEAKELFGKKYIWNHDIANIVTTGYIEFLEDGILQTTWQNGTYQFINNNLAICQWGMCNPEHYFIFNDDKKLIYSYRPHMSHFSCAIRME